MAMCHLCQRNLLMGERYRLWTGRGVVGERTVCRLCEEDAESLGDGHRWLDGLLLALLLAFVARPLVVGPLLWPARLRVGERIFVLWGGLKGAVPILLGTFALLEGVDEADRIYGIVFVVVAFSVLVQGTSVPFVAPLLRVPMRQREPRGLQRFVVADGSRAAGHPIRELPLGERTWIQEVVRDGLTLEARGSVVLEPGDEVLTVVSDAGDAAGVGRIFAGES